MTRSAVQKTSGRSSGAKSARSVVGDVLDRDVDAVGGEELARAGDEPLPVSASIAAQGLDDVHLPSMPKAEWSLRFKRFLRAATPGVQSTSRERAPKRSGRG